MYDTETESNLSKKVAVVILNWNGRQLLEKFLPSVMSNSAEADLYVADNASTDDSVDFIRNNYPSVKVIRNAGNFGYAKGYNDALKSVPSEILVLLNSDVEVTSNWLQPAIDIFGSDGNIAAIQPKVLDYKDKSKFEYAGAAGGFLDKFGYPFCRGRIFSEIETDNCQYDDQRDIFWASGACLFIRKSAFDAAQGFDADFFAHQEEIDLCWRLHNLGHQIVFCPKSVVYHVGGATLNDQSAQKTFLNFRNSLFMLLKNLPKNKLAAVIFGRMLLDGLAGVNFLFQLRPLHTWAIIRAHFAFYAKIRRFYRKRESHQLQDYAHTNSIVYDYYIRKRKRYTDLF